MKTDDDNLSYYLFLAALSMYLAFFLFMTVIALLEWTGTSCAYSVVMSTGDCKVIDSHVITKLDNLDYLLTVILFNPLASLGTTIFLQIFVVIPLTVLFTLITTIRGNYESKNKND